MCKNLMLRFLVIFITVPIFLTSCRSSHSHTENKPVGMPNPASVYCIEQGGKLVPKRHKDGGEFALCKLPNGKIIEEWKLNRQSFVK